MKHCLAKLALTAALMASCWQACADDIDLFVDAPASTDRPNVLFILDNTGNWNTAFDNEMDALRSVIEGLPEDKFNVGLMMFGEPQVGYVRAAIREMNEENRDIYAALINSLRQVQDRESARTLARTFSEAHRYLKGLNSTDATVLLAKAKRDYRGNTFGTSQSRDVYDLPGNALNSSITTRYTSPLDAASCARTYIIYIGNTVPSGNVVIDNEGFNQLAGAELLAAGGSTTQISLDYDSHERNYADEWASFLKEDMGVSTYTVDVDPTPMPPLSGHINGRGNSALLQSMATESGGKYFRVNSGVGGGQEIADALNGILSEIQAVNSVFAAVSLPVSINTQGTYLNQVYIGLFRPDPKPRWFGNLKQYKLGYTNGLLRLQDADSDPAININTGFITECARSFWTPTDPDTYWAFSPRGTCLEEGVDPSSNTPDGSVVESGGQAYMLRGSTTRALKTCSPTLGACTTLTNFLATNTDITDTLLNATSAAEGDELIDWARGLDVDDEDDDDVVDEMRPSAHGDVVHSRPVAINFGTATAPKVVVFYGGNDGVFRAINGNRTDLIEGVQPGAELWGFIPPEFYGQIKRLRGNTPKISFPNITSGSPLPKPYAVDGAITAHLEGSNAWIYASMRRGGRVLYSFNVDRANPTAITLKWRVGCADNFPLTGTVSDANCSVDPADVGDFEGIGQTWSAPKIFKAQGYNSGANPLLIMGGGYDPCEDASPNTCTASSKGNKVYVMDASTGVLQQTLTTDRGVVADVVVVPNPATGLAAYAYVADLGGNLYRVNIGTAAPGAWTITKIASLGCDTVVAACANNRKFMFAPDVLEEGGGYVLLVGSGDREKPREYTNPVDNHFFMVRDKPTDTTWLSSESSNCGDTVICRASLLGITTDADPTAADLATKKGWYLGLIDNEQVVTAAITIFGTVTFSTHTPVLPVSGSCSSNLGEARVYNISYANAAREDGAERRFDLLPQQIGLPPSPVAGLVTLDSGQTVPFCFGCSADSPLEAEEPVIPPSVMPAQPKSRVYWYIQR